MSKIKKSKKQNFLRSQNIHSTKGDNIYDSVTSQKPIKERKITQSEIDIMHNDYSFNKNLLNEISSSAIRKGFSIDSGNQEIDKKVMQRFKDLECGDYIVSLLENGLKDGIAFLYPVMEGINLVTGEKLELNKIKKIIDFNIFYARDINTIYRQMDKMIPHYSECQKLFLKILMEIQQVLK